MAPPPGSSSVEHDGALDRCIRDLAMLNAIPSMCIGRSPHETLEIILEALPTALDCDLIYLKLPGSEPEENAKVRGSRIRDAALADLVAALPSERDHDCACAIPGVGTCWCFEATVPLSAGSGRLVAGRRSPLDARTDRVLVRSAANLVGTALETARVLENARRKDEFLAVLGHELRNPLAPIVTAAELLAREPSVAREQAIIERHAKHLARLVDDLLDISRVTTGHIELRQELVMLDAVLERAVELVARSLARNQHALHVEKAPDVMVRGDAVRLAQVFGNLLANATKFTPAGGAIDIGVQRSAGGVRVAVRDSGRGIARDQLDRIFEPFVQAEGPADAFRGGLGLGLAIVKNLVGRHGGTIEAQSDGKGRGATFVVELPVVISARPPSETEADAPLDAAATSNARHGMRVLVVDDNVDMAELLSEALRLEGFDTAVEHDARAALERWRSFMPQAGIFDVGLPELDGYELAKAVRAEHGSEPMLFAVTGYGQHSDRVRARDAGFDRHFVKPVSVRELATTLRPRSK